MTCFDTPFPQHSHFTHMPIFLGGVSVHPRHQARHPTPFEDQFTDPTALPHSVLVSLDFPSVVSAAAARFFRKCYATTAAGRTVVLVGGFRDCPSNRRIRRVLSHIAPIGRQDAMLLLTFPKGPFPAGTVMGWPEPPEGDMQEHATFSQHMCFGVPTHAQWGWTPGRSIDMPTWPSIRVTRALYCSHHAPPSVWRLSRQHGYFISRPCYTAHWCHIRPEAIDTPSCGAGGRTHPLHCATRTFRLRPIWTPFGASGCARGSMMKTLFRPLPRPTTTCPRWPGHGADCSCYETTQIIPSLSTSFRTTSLLSCGHTRASMPPMPPWRRWRSPAPAWADSSRSNAPEQL